MEPGGDKGGTSEGNGSGRFDWNSDVENFQTQGRRNKKGKTRVNFNDGNSDDSSDNGKGERRADNVGKDQSGVRNIGGNSTRPNPGNVNVSLRGVVNNLSGGGQSSANSKQGDSSGLNPNRVRGFGNQITNNTVESPTLNQMRAKQGAIVAKFMTFFRRKSTKVILKCTRPAFTKTSQSGIKLLI